jgi:hypothetical protein
VVKNRKKIGTYDAVDINYTSGYLKELVQKYNLPPKVFTVQIYPQRCHEFKKHPSAPECRWYAYGWLVLAVTWSVKFICRRAVRYTRFNFLSQRHQEGHSLMHELLKLNPKPLYPVSVAPSQYRICSFFHLAKRRPSSRLAILHLVKAHGVPCRLFDANLEGNSGCWNSR